MIVHFITTSSNWPYSYYLALCSAVLVHKPEKTILWYLKDIPKGQYWLATEKFFSSRSDQCEVKFYDTRGLPDNTYLYKDVCELEILYEHGGLFLDLDTLSIQPIVMDPAKEIYAPPEHDSLQYFNNAVLGCQRRSSLMEQMAAEARQLALTEEPPSFGSPTFGNTGPRLISRYVLKNQDKIELPPVGTAGNHPNWNYWRNEEILPIVRVMHMFAACQSEFGLITSPKYIQRVQNVYTKMVRKVLPEEVWNPLFYIEIGANSFDTLKQKHQSSNRWYGISIEAIPEYAEKPSLGHEVLTNVAITNESSGKQTFYYVSKNNINQSGVPFWASGIGTLNAELSHLKEFPDKVSSIQIDAININEFLDSYKIKEIEELKIDTEGLDAKLLLSLDISKYSPNSITFEKKHLTNKDIQDIRTKYFNWNYIEQGENATLVKSCRYLLPPFDVLKHFTSLSKIVNREKLYQVIGDIGLTGKGVEVGVHAGVNAQNIYNLWMRKDNALQELYLIDYWNSTVGGYVSQEITWDDLYKSVCDKFNHDARVRVIRKASLEAVQIFLDNELDFVYIDANHKYEEVKKDLESWYPKVRHCGIFAGHDYIPDGDYNGYLFGVKKAVDEFVRERGLGLFITMEGNWPSWYLVKP